VIGDETLAAFRDAVRARLAGHQDGTERLDAALHAVVVEARAARVGVEQLVIRLKAEWDALASREEVAHDVKSADVRDGVISAAIKAYYVQ
jgi:hypothetical protein